MDVPRGQLTIAMLFVVIAQLHSRVSLFATPWTAAHQASLSFSISQSLLKLMSIELMMPSNHLILCHPLLLLPPVLPSLRVFSNESALCISWPKYWSFSFNISPSNEHPGLISFRIDWFDLLLVQGSLLQHHSSKASTLWHSAFFTVQLSHPYTTTAIALQLNNSAWACRTPAVSQSPAFVNKHIGAQPHPFISVLSTVAHVLQHEKWVAMTEITSLNYVPSGPLRKGLLTSASK